MSDLTTLLTSAHPIAILIVCAAIVVDGWIIWRAWRG